MFEPVIAVAAICIGVCTTARLRRGEKLVPFAVLTALVATGLFTAITTQWFDYASGEAADELVRDDNAVVDSTSAKFLALHASEHPLRIYPGHAGSRLLTLQPDSCPLRLRYGSDEWLLRRERHFDYRSSPLRWLRHKRLLPPLQSPVLCDFALIGFTSNRE
jgi:hypothetical protein